MLLYLLRLLSVCLIKKLLLYSSSYASPSSVWHPYCFGSQWHPCYRQYLKHSSTEDKKVMADVSFWVNHPFSARSCKWQMLMKVKLFLEMKLFMLLCLFFSLLILKQWSCAPLWDPDTEVVSKKRECEAFFGAIKASLRAPFLQEAPFHRCYFSSLVLFLGATLIPHNTPEIEALKNERILTGSNFSIADEK